MQNPQGSVQHGCDRISTIIVALGGINGGGRSTELTDLSSVLLFYGERTGKSLNCGANLCDFLEFDTDSSLQNSKLQANSLLSD